MDHSKYSFILYAFSFAASEIRQQTLKRRSRQTQTTKGEKEEPLFLSHSSLDIHAPRSLFRYGLSTRVSISVLLYSHQYLLDF
ncbi:hypothetical protein L1987_59745 [Smallanthus sonchifolius]|uniref:Uncharacterized protein n=1 Tax=Smallanthus sonchifolius TaxID=185202 RepID=A0ACB9D6B7_9ASTR|nr:hypothetical protein L1987_59745 [Smallanthus sonchifolius]